MQVLPIGIDNQIDNALFGQSENEKTEVGNKVKFVAENINKVETVNGHKIYDQIVIGDDIWYNLNKIPKRWEYLLQGGNGRKYYYPIQYSNITFLDNKPTNTH